MSGRSARTIRFLFSRTSAGSGLTGRQKVHFSTFDGKLESQCTRNGPKNPPFCPGSLQNTFIVFPRYLTTRFPKIISQQKKLENRTSENLKFQTPRFTNKCPGYSFHEISNCVFTRLLLVNLGFLGFSQKLVFSLF